MLVFEPAVLQEPPSSVEVFFSGPFWPIVVGAIVALFSNIRLTKEKAIIDSRLSRETERLKVLLQASSDDAASRRIATQAKLERVYKECGVIELQLFRAADEAHVAIREFALASSRGSVDPAFHLWFRYITMAPLALSRLLERRLTAADLSLDSGLERRRRIVQCIVEAHHVQHGIADSTSRWAPKNLAQVGESSEPKVAEVAAKASGEVLISRASLELVLDSMIDGDRCLTFREFSVAHADEGSVLRQSLDSAAGMANSESPVFWKVACVQMLGFGRIARHGLSQAPYDNLLFALGPDDLELIGERTDVLAARDYLLKAFARRDPAGHWSTGVWEMGMDAGAAQIRAAAGKAA